MADVPENDPFSLETCDKNISDIIEGEGLIISENAKLKLADIIRDRKGKWALRVVVEGGGCSGFIVKFVLEDQFNEEDIFFGEENSLFVVDYEALSIIPKAHIDYHTSLAGSFFRLDVPDAVAKCGCGESFAL